LFGNWHNTYNICFYYVLIKECKIEYDDITCGRTLPKPHHNYERTWTDHGRTNFQTHDLI